MFRKITTLSFFCFIFLFPVLAQSGNDYGKLFDLYVMEKWEDLLWKSIKYTEKDDTRRDPEPYLYASIAYLKIWEDPELSQYEEYDKALRDAMKYGYKVRRKDDTDSLFHEFKSHYDELRKAAIADSRQYFDEEDYRKAGKVFRYLLKAYQDPNLQYMKGVCDALSRNSSSATMEFDESIPKLKENYGKEGYESDPVSEPILAEAFVLYSDYLMEEMPDSAKSTISLGYSLLKDNNKVEKQYNKIFDIKVKEEPKEELKKAEGTSKVSKRVHTSEVGE